MEQSSRSFTPELEAMAAIGQILCDLPDPASRQRVLQWAVERFAAERAVTSSYAALEAVPASPVQEAGGDPALAIGSLDEMFVITTFAEMDEDLSEFAGPAPIAAPAPVEPRQPLDVMIRSFAQDFQRFAEEWNGATA
jgi:hypothetical protein